MAAKELRGEPSRNMDAHYYGYRDEEDGILLEEERKAEIICKSFVLARG